MTNDPQVYRGFVSVNLSSFYSGQIFFGGAFEDLSTSAKICQVAENHPHLWNVADDWKFV